jgi:DUF4097 and DUF4098 domain-containing protein YvlB
MRRLKPIILFITFIGMLLPMNGFSLNEQEILKSFKGKTEVRLNTLSGDCVVKTGPGNEIKVRFVHTYSNTTFEPQFLEEGSTLVLKEKFHISGSGNSTWYLTVPEKTAVKFHSISGDFSIKGVKANIDATTVSGDVVAKNCSGDLEFKSANGDLEVEGLSGNVTVRGASSDLKVKDLSGNIHVKTASGDLDAENLQGSVVIKSPSGDIEIKGAKGSFDVKTASGEIYASGIEITKKSYFKAASGDIQITLAKSAAHDLELDTASGDAVLNYNGNPIQGYFEFRVAARSGDINSPYPFEKEEEEEKWGRKYIIKSFKRKSDTPKISIRTASGTAELREK